MSKLTEALEELIIIEGQEAFDPALVDCRWLAVYEELVDAAMEDVQGMMEVFKGGTDDEFAALINCIDEIPYFDDEEVMHELIAYAKSRGKAELLDGLKAVYESMYP